MLKFDEEPWGNVPSSWLTEEDILLRVTLSSGPALLD